MKYHVSISTGYTVTKLKVTANNIREAIEAAEDKYMAIGHDGFHKAGTFEVLSAVAWSK